MNERIIKILSDIRMAFFDTGMGFISYFSMAEVFGIAINAFVAVSVAVVGGSILFLFQKTILPILAEKINEKIIKWFNKK